MVRAQASDRNKHVGVLFASVVTESTGTCESQTIKTIGRSGPHSIFDLLSKAIPSTTRDKSRNGLTMVELNKALEKNGFLRVRLRAIKRIAACRREMATTTYRFGRRRFRNPDCPADMDVIAEAWWHLSKLVGTNACSLEHLCSILRETISADPAPSWHSRYQVSDLHVLDPSLSQEAGTKSITGPSLTDDSSSLQSPADTDPRDSPHSVSSQSSGCTECYTEVSRVNVIQADMELAEKLEKERLLDEDLPCHCGFATDLNTHSNATRFHIPLDILPRDNERGTCGSSAVPSTSWL